MKLKQPSLSLALACSLATVPPFARADDPQVSGTVQKMMSVGGLGSAPGNADLRVWLNGVNTVCTGANDASWAYINANDPNFKGVAATISTAYAMGKPLMMATRLSAVGNGNYCQIVWVIVSG